MRLAARLHRCSRHRLLLTFTMRLTQVRPNLTCRRRLRGILSPNSQRSGEKITTTGVTRPHTCGLTRIEAHLCAPNIPPLESEAVMGPEGDTAECPLEERSTRRCGERAGQGTKRSKARREGAAQGAQGPKPETEHAMIPGDAGGRCGKIRKLATPPMSTMDEAALPLSISLRRLRPRSHATPLQPDIARNFARRSEETRR